MAFLEGRQLDKAVDALQATIEGLQQSLAAAEQVLLAIHLQHCTPTYAANRRRFSTRRSDGKPRKLSRPSNRSCRRSRRRQRK